jgi:DNA-binding response OmpR family regulator
MSETLNTWAFVKSAGSFKDQLAGDQRPEDLRRVRREPSTALIPIIMVTAKASALDVANVRDAGVDAYLTKPFSARAVTERIGLLLSRGQSRRTPKIL